MVTRSGIENCCEAALGCIEVTGNQSTQRSLMKVAELELGGIHSASPTQQLEQLDRRGTTRHRDTVEMTPLKAGTCFGPHLTIRQDTRAIDLVERLKVTGKVHDISDRCIGETPGCPNVANHRRSQGKANPGAEWWKALGFPAGR